LAKAVEALGKTFFATIAELKLEEGTSSDKLHIIFRSSGYEEVFQTAIEDYHADDIIELVSFVSYGGALQEMLIIDGLLIMNVSRHKNRYS
jgi:hypothetical protein